MRKDESTSMTDGKSGMRSRALESGLIYSVDMVGTDIAADAPIDAATGEPRCQASVLWFIEDRNCV